MQFIDGDIINILACIFQTKVYTNFEWMNLILCPRLWLWNICFLFRHIDYWATTEDVRGDEGKSWINIWQFWNDTEDIRWSQHRVLPSGNWKTLATLVVTVCFSYLVTAYYIRLRSEGQEDGMCMNRKTRNVRYKEA